MANAMPTSERGETIAEVGPNLRPSANTRIIEAAGLVLPGAIDPHTHLHPSFADDLTSGSMAALAGGITTVGTFANATAKETLPDAVERMAGRVRSEAIADVILHASAWPPSPDTAAAMKTLAAIGQPSFKVFLTRQDAGARVPIHRALEHARAAGVVTLMHCEDGALLAAAVRRLRAKAGLARRLRRQPAGGGRNRGHATGGVALRKHGRADLHRASVSARALASAARRAPHHDCRYSSRTRQCICT